MSSFFEEWWVGSLASWLLDGLLGGWLEGGWSVDWLEAGWRIIGWLVFWLAGWSGLVHRAHCQLVCWLVGERLFGGWYEDGWSSRGCCVVAWCTVLARGWLVGWLAGQWVGWRFARGLLEVGWLLCRGLVHRAHCLFTSWSLAAKPSHWRTTREGQTTQLSPDVVAT